MNKEETLVFIKLYRKKNILWDPKHPNHYNKKEKENAWKEISKESKKSVDECKRKIEYLLTALRREKMKINKSIGYQSSWFAFDSMKFILEKTKYIQPSNLVQGDQEFNRPGTCEEFSSSKLQNKDTSSNHCSQQIAIKRRKLQSCVQQQCCVRDRELSTTTKNVVDDECFHFGNLVASKLCIYNNHVRCFIQNDILNIFLKANKGYYNNFNSSPNHILEETVTVNPSYPSTYIHSPAASISFHNS
ncbi:uncharacterized protein LOC108004503 [Apis cerana]|uniref:uncharacterized protein LOC108004503 n=1 Tax=Apis cerana TaxID=7461 RepID=UPI0007E2CE97|nr:uncharacterized protein LOC108004503 [Apis cerana]